MALPTSDAKFDTNLIGCIPTLTSQDNYDIWWLQIQTTLSAYSVWEFIDGTLTYAAQPDAVAQLKWNLLDKWVLGLMASTINDSLLIHVKLWIDRPCCLSFNFKGSLGSSQRTLCNSWTPWTVQSILPGSPIPYRSCQCQLVYQRLSCPVPEAYWSWIQPPWNPMGHDSSFGSPKQQLLAHFHHHTDCQSC